MSSSFSAYKLPTRFDPPHTHHDLTTWSTLHILGAGGFGTVRLERETHGSLRAVKQIPKTGSSPWNPRELLALTRLNSHPQYFVRFFGWFEDDHNVFLAMEYVPGGDLEALVGRLQEGEVAEVARQVLEGLRVMHEEGFCHRDLKPQNILLVSRTPIAVKITDFGITKHIGTDSNTQLLTAVGTPSYTAPEVLGYITLSPDSSAYTSAVDIWSLGCLLYTLLTSARPFISHGVLSDYLQSRISFPKTVLRGAGASASAVKFIAGLLRPHPDDRPTAAQALESAWLDGGGGTAYMTEATDSTRWPTATLLVEQPDCATVYCAITHGNLTALRRLCDGGAGIDVNERPVDGQPLLHLATRSVHCTEEMLRVLLRAGAVAGARNGHGETALHVAARAGFEGKARVLVVAGAGVEVRDRRGETAVEVARGAGWRGMVEVLGEGGGGGGVGLDGTGWIGSLQTALPGGEARDVLAEFAKRVQGMQSRVEMYKGTMGGLEGGSRGSMGGVGGMSRQRGGGAGG